MRRAMQHLILVEGRQSTWDITFRKHGRTDEVEGDQNGWSLLNSVVFEGCVDISHCVR
jgi:hypothetical protein